MSQDEFLSNVGELLEMPQPPTPATRLEDIESWDSMAMVSFIAFADEHFSKKLSARSFAGSETVSDLAKLCGID